MINKVLTTGEMGGWTMVSLYTDCFLLEMAYIMEDVIIPHHRVSSGGPIFYFGQQSSRV